MLILIGLPMLFLAASIVYTTIKGLYSFYRGASGDTNRKSVFILLVISRAISLALIAILLYMLLVSGVVVTPHLAIGFIFHYVAIYLIYNEFVSVIFRTLSLYHAAYIAKKKLGDRYDR